MDTNFKEKTQSENAAGGLNFGDLGLGKTSDLGLGKKLLDYIIFYHYQISILSL